MRSVMVSTNWKFCLVFSLVLFCANLAVTVTRAQTADEEEFRYDDHNKRDPFWRLVSPNGVIMSYETDLLITDMILEGVIYDPNGNSLAIINGKVKGVGQKTGLFTLTEIHRDHVIMEKGSERYVLRLKKEE